MGKTMSCSMWSHGYCPDCNLYTDKLCRGYPVKPKDVGAETFRTLKFETKQPAGEGEIEQEPKIRLNVIDVEHSTSRVCDLSEAKAWDWGNPEIMRVIGDWQITNYEMLLFNLREKESKGLEQVDLFEAPRFMMLAGG